MVAKLTIMALKTEMLWQLVAENWPLSVPAASIATFFFM
jgi:hypothetical protein